MDWLGAALATLGLGLVVYALIDSIDPAGARRMFPLLGLGAATLVGFVVVEAKRKAPMVPLSLFRSHVFSGANLLTFLLYAALGGALFFVPFNLIQLQHYSPPAAGAALLPLVLIIAAMSPWAGGLTARVNARLPLVVGPLLASAGFALLAGAGTGGSYFAAFFPGVAVLGIGMGVTVAPLTATVMGSVEAEHSGVASGVNNAVARTAGLLAIAALGVVLRGQFERVLDRHLSAMSLAPDVAAAVEMQRGKLMGADLSAIGGEALRSSLRRAFEAAYVSGFRALMIVSAALAGLSALAALVLIDRPPQEPDASRKSDGQFVE
jgi:hypothetical protein